MLYGTRWLFSGVVIVGLSLVGMRSVGRADVLIVPPPYPGGLPQCMQDVETCTVNLDTCTTALGNTLGQFTTCTANLTSCSGDLAMCQTDLGACEEGAAVFPGDGQEGTVLDFGFEHGPELSYADNCMDDGTFIDNNTGLMWECKTDDNTMHDKDNNYTWTDVDDGDFTNPDGTVFTVFLASLNIEPCFVGHCDWRLPTVKEMQSIVDYSKYSPATSVPGERESSFYWSSTSFANNPGLAWYVNFGNGVVGTPNKSTPLRVRAVRDAQ